MNKEEKTKSPRRCSREYAVQALYQWQLSSPPLNELLLNFSNEHNFDDADKAYWNELVTQSIKQAKVLNEKMQPFLSRSIDAINPVELAILRVSFYELSERPDVPYRVIINEAIELTKVFGAVESHRFINGVLDAAAKQVRAAEVALKRKNK